MTVPNFLHPYSPPAAETFISIADGTGSVVRDTQGREYIDAMSSLWYCNVGHGRQEIIDAITGQLQRLDAFHTFDVFTNPLADALAGELVTIAPGDGFRVFFTSSGSEAVDSAIKIARAAHSVAGREDRKLVISRTPSYHGVTYGGLAATGLPANQQHFGAMLADVVQVPYDDAGAVRKVAEEHPGQLAAVISEPVVGAGGVYPPPAGYLAELRDICDAYGAFLILDEVITGFGRLGHWWGAGYYGVRPDLVTFAKGITSGYVPLGGVLVGPAVRGPLESDPSYVLRHGHTYSGHPTACAAAIANLHILREEDLLSRAPVIGAQLAKGLRELEGRGLVAEVRGAGAVWAVGMHDDVDAVAVRDAMLERGVIPRAIGSPTLSFCPPLITTSEQVDTIVAALDSALQEVM